MSTTAGGGTDTPTATKSTAGVITRSSSSTIISSSVGGRGTKLSAPPAKKLKTSSSQSLVLGKLTIGFIGAGNMAKAIAEGLIASGQISASQIIASATSLSSEKLKKMKALGVNTTISNSLVVTTSDVIIIAVKPHLALGVLGEFHDFYTAAQASSNPPKNLRPLIVSVASSVTITDMECKTSVSWQITGLPAVKGHLPVVRCLPTISTSINAGITVYTKGTYCRDNDAEPFTALFSLISHCEEVPEKYMNAFTAFSGSGIAFMAVTLEAMADGGVMAGIPRDMAQRVAAHTMLSTAQLILEKKLHPAEVKDAVASPGGTTIHGLQTLECSGFRGSLMSAVKAAADRAELMNPSKT